MGKKRPPDPEPTLSERLLVPGSAWLWQVLSPPAPAVLKVQLGRRAYDGPCVVLARSMRESDYGASLLVRLPDGHEAVAIEGSEVTLC